MMTVMMAFEGREGINWKTSWITFPLSLLSHSFPDDDEDDDDLWRKISLINSNERIFHLTTTTA